MSQHHQTAVSVELISLKMCSTLSDSESSGQPSKGFKDKITLFYVCKAVCVFFIDWVCVFTYKDTPLLISPHTDLHYLMT